MADTAEIGVFGGSGFYSLLDDVREIKVDTPYGPPSDSLFLADVAGRRVAFLPRHGRRHTIPPHQINYRANVWAMRSLGVKAAISPCAAGSLQLAVKPGDFVVCDQFVDRTSGRPHTFFDGPIVTHLSSAETYDPVLRGLAIDTIRDHGIEVHERGTVVVIQGPRFSTKAESKWFSDAGWEVINMTQYPEAWLCRELGMAVVNISLITDYDAGVHEGTEAVNATDVLEVFTANAERIQKVVLDLIGRFPADLDALGARDALGPTRGDGHTISRRGHPALRDRDCDGVVTGPADGASTGRLPIGVSLRTIRAEPAWWLESARRLDEAGYAGVWAWDHFMGRGDLTVPVVEGWTALAMAAGATRADRGRVVRAQRDEPAPGGRGADGLDPPDRERRPARPRHRHRRAPEGARRLRDRVPAAARPGRPARGGRRGHPGAVDRRTGDARVAVLPADRGVRLAGARPGAADRHRRRDRRPGRAWRPGSAMAGPRSRSDSRRDLPLYLEGSAAAGRAARGPAGHRRVPGRVALRRDAGSDRRGSTAPAETWARWREAGADGVIVLARTTADIDALVDAVGRW